MHSIRYGLLWQSWHGRPSDCWTQPLALVHLKTAKSIEIVFVMSSFAGPRNLVLDGTTILPCEGAICGRCSLVIRDQYYLGCGCKTSNQSRSDTPHQPDPWTWPMTLTVNPLQALVITYSRINVQGLWSISSKHRAETHGPTEGIALLASLTPCVIM